MTEIDALKYDLEQERKAFDKLHKRHIELLKQQGALEKENEQLKSSIWKCRLCGNTGTIEHIAKRNGDVN